MSYSPTAELFDTDHARTRRALIPAALAVLVATAGLTIYGAHDLREIAIVISVLALVIAGVFGFLLPRKLTHDSAGGTALTLSLIAAAVLLPAFWSGLPLVLGASGAMLGYAGRNATTGSGKCVAALVIGTVASIGYFTVYVSDALSQAGVSWA